MTYTLKSQTIQDYRQCWQDAIFVYNSVCLLVNYYNDFHASLPLLDLGRCASMSMSAVGIT